MAWDVASFKTILAAKQGAAEDTDIQDAANETLAEAVIEFLNDNLKISLAGVVTGTEAETLIGDGVVKTV